MGILDSIKAMFSGGSNESAANTEAASPAPSQANAAQDDQGHANGPEHQVKAEDKPSSVEPLQDEAASVSAAASTAAPEMPKTETEKKAESGACGVCCGNRKP